MKTSLLIGASLITLALPAFATAADLSQIKTIVVIYAENRSFDSLYGTFPGANGLANATDVNKTQLDRDGTPLKELPASWGGLLAKGVKPEIPEEATRHLPNAPFQLDDAKGFNVGFNIQTRDMVHRFYQDQMQIDGGKNDKYAAWTDAGGVVMGTWDGSRMSLWDIAKKYTLADNFFQGAFGGSFLNHIWLACACAPYYPDADKAAARPTIAAVEADGVTLKLSDTSPKSALEGPPKFVSDGNLTPDFYAVNTMQPPYQPSQNKPAEGADAAYADPSKPNTLPPQSATTIGDLLSTRGVSWAWYSGAWAATLAGQKVDPDPVFQFHHQPYNYFKAYAPGTEARKDHLRDGGLAGVELIKDIDAGKLPDVTFYKPQGNLNQHPGYANISAGDAHIADVIAHLEKSPQWANMVVVVTYDENGGAWDHAAPPKADRWGPGTRIPALVISPFARKGFVDHTPQDTTSILRLITKRYQLPVLDGIKARDEAVARAGQPPLGDLTTALNLKN